VRANEASTAAGRTAIRAGRDWSRRLGASLRRHTPALVVAWATTFAAAVVLLVALSWPTRSHPPGNLVANGGFEQGVAPWRAFGDAPLERTADHARFGSEAAAVTAPPDESAGVFWYGAVVRPRRGERYSVSAWVRAGPGARGDRIVVSVTEHAGGFEDEEVAGAEAYLASKWVRLHATGTVARRGRAALDIAIFVPEPNHVGERFYVDGISLVRGPARASGADAAAARRAR
jgi:hypothetical protein